MKICLLLLIVTAFSCDTDSQCLDLQFCSEGECKHKPLFPLALSEVIGCFLIFISSGLANAAGIGGGALFVAYFVLLFGCNPSDAVALGQTNIIGGCFATLAIKIFHRHPSKDRPVIEYDILLLIISPVLIGTSLGVIINIILPYWAIVLILVVIIGYLTTGMVTNAKKKYKQENNEISEVAREIPMQEVSRTPIKNLQDVDENHKDSDIECSRGLIDNENLQKIYKAERRYIPFRKIPAILCVFILVALASLARGSRTVKSAVGLVFCSGSYWLLSFLTILLLLNIFALCSWYIMNTYKHKVENNYQFDAFDIKWTVSDCGTLGFFGFFAGLIGSIIGVGGAIIMNPVLLRYKLRPEVVTATSTSIIVFTSGISALQYAIAGRINLEYALWTASFSFIGAAIGVFVLKKIVEKYRRTSIIIMALAVAMGLSAVISATYGIYTTVKTETDFWVHSYC